MKHRLYILLATGFGLGFSPFASGTTGTLPGVALALALAPLHWGLQAGVSVLLILAAVPVCGYAERVYGKKDDGRIVMDEYATFPLCVIGLPILSCWWLVPLAFVTHRVLDIIKPPPARQSQALGGGTGIVVDDVVSGLYALALNHLAYRLITSWL